MSARGAPEGRSPAKPADLGHLHVLILEGNKADAQLCTEALKNAGFDFEADRVLTPEQFTQHIRQDKYDLILADYRLPSWSGMDAFEAMNHAGQDIPFILIAAGLGEELAADCIKKGVADYILKGGLARLAEAIPQALERKAARDRHQKAEAAVHASEAMYRSLVEQAPFGIYRSSIDSDRFLAVNPALVNMLGYSSAEELLQLRISSGVFLKPSREDFLKAISALDNYLGMELEWRRKDGSTVMVRVSGKTIRDQQGKVVAEEVIAEDLTQFQKLEQQLRRTQKMDAIGRLAGGVAHDFNNLLGVIMGNAELLEGLMLPNDPRMLRIEEIHKASRRAASLTRQLLAFSRKQVSRPRVLDLNSIIGDMSRMLQRLIGEHIGLSTSLEPELWPMKADASQLQQVIANLAVNARDAMPSGGKLSISTNNAKLETQYPAWNSNVVPGDYVLLTVNDTGSGMDTETQTHIFEPFFTTKEVGKGTGLGLATVYGIVEQTGGHIWMYSEPGRGSTFKIYFPRAEQESPDIPEPKPSTTNLSGTETILLVEDEAALRATAAEFLKGAGYQVLEAHNPEEAIELVRRHKNTISLLLTDVVMPGGINGRQLAEKIRELTPTIKVLYMSGYTDDLLVHDGVLEAGIAILEKPFSRLGLLQKLRETLG